MDRSAVQRDDLFNDRQTQAAAAFLSGPGLIDTIESAEDVGQRVLRDTDTGIGDDD